MEQKKAVGIWIRVSTEDQAKGESPEHHLKRAQLYADSKGWEVVTVYHLEALSGKSVMSYSETKRMLEDVKANKISGLIFSKLARLARNTKELLEFADIFKEYDVDLISLQEAIDTSTPAGRLFYTMIAAMAQWEREEIADRIAASIPIRAKLGKKIGSLTSYGFHWNDKTLEIHPIEGPIKKLAFELFVQHRRKGTVARILNEMGYRNRKGTEFVDVLIERMLRDPMAKGIRRVNYTTNKNGKGWSILKPESDWVLHPCPALVDENLWNECNRILDEQKRGKKPAKKATHLFTGVLRCATCNLKMYVPSESKKYFCSKCHGRILATDLEEIYYENLKHFVLTQDDIQTFLSKANATINEKQQQIDALQLESKQLHAQMDKLVDLHLAGEIPKDGFANRYNPLFEQSAQIKNTIPELQGEIDYLQMEILNSDHVLSEAKSLYDSWPKLDFETKRNIVEQVTDKILITKEEVTIRFNYSPLFSKTTVDSQHMKLRGSGRASVVWLFLRHRCFG